jgi:predicted transglutaminase-like cysteine proteinase
MGSKLLAVVAIVIVIAVAVLFLDTRLLLGPIADRIPFSEPEVTSKAVLRVDGYVDEAGLAEDAYVIKYSVSNVGNANAENVTFTAVVDGESQPSHLVSSLSVSDSANYSLVVSNASNALHVVSLQASCTDAADFYSFSFGAEVPRTFSDKPELVKLFVTPREPVLVALKNEILGDKWLVKDWIALRDWVGKNIQYKNDAVVHDVTEYWQFGKETASLRTGDCEDFAILLVSLFRANGFSADDVYVVVGRNAEGYHAWVRIKLETFGWYNLEPQESGLATFTSDFLTLSGFQALYQFNDQQFHKVG